MKKYIQLFWQSFILLLSSIFSYATAAILTQLVQKTSVEVFRETALLNGSFIYLSFFLLLLLFAWQFTQRLTPFYLKIQGIVMIAIGVMIMTLCDWLTLKIIAGSIEAIVIWHIAIMILWFYAWKKNKTTPHVMPSRENTDTSIRQGDSIQMFSGEEIISWSRSEKPILSKSEDYLGLYDWAGKIANILKKSNTEGGCSIGLQGGWGSGKTSTINMLKYHIDSDNEQVKYLLSTVSCWGFSTSQAAIHYLLATIVGEMEKKGVCVDSIRNVPDQYVQTINHIDSFWGKIAQWFFDDWNDSLDATLNKIGDLLKNKNLHFVLVIEDLDRSEPKHFSIQDVFAAIYNLKKIQDNFSLILSGNVYAEAVKIDFEKLSDHILTVPKIDEKAIK